MRCNSVHFRAVWENTAHVQGIRYSPKGSHLIPWTISCIFQYRTQMNTVSISSHTQWLCFYYETYIGISQYRIPHVDLLYACYIAGKRGMLLTERRWVLWSSVMSVNCTLICAVESFEQSCGKIQTVFIFVRYGKIQHMSKE